MSQGWLKIQFVSSFTIPDSILLLYYLTYLQKRKLDAVYYYMRSLAASNPILTAKESLMSLFEEAKRKVWHFCC